MNHVKRQGLIVWFQHRKHIKNIRRYGHLMYVSKRMRFAVLYVNQEEIDSIQTALKRHSFVKKVEPSYKPFIDTSFENSKPDQAKMYDYQ